MKVFNEFFEEGIINGITSETYICLISKKQESVNIKDFRSIGWSLVFTRSLVKFCR